MDMVKFKPSNDQLVQWSLRLGLTLVFLYAGVGSLLHPYEWIAKYHRHIGTGVIGIRFTVLWKNMHAQL